MRRFGTIAVLVAFLGAIGLLLIQVTRVVNITPDALEGKVVRATRRLYYQVLANAGPRFDLAGVEGMLLVATHARLPPGPYDPMREIVYGLRLDVVAEQVVIWSQDFWIRARQSKARLQDGVWLDENTFSLERDVEVTDERDLWLQLPPELPPKANLQLRLLGSVGEALVRVNAQEERSGDAKSLRLWQLTPTERETLAERLTYLPWDRLRSDERLMAVRYSANCLPAVGLNGVDYETRTLYFTGFRLPVPPTATGLVVGPARAAALNVQGPTALTLMVTQAGDTPFAMTVSSVGEGPQPGPWSLGVPPAGTDAVHALAIPAGVHSIQLRAPREVRVEVMGPPGRNVRFGRPLPAASDVLVPEEVRLPAYLSLPGRAPVLVALDGPNDVLGRLVRVDVRLIDADRGALVFEFVGARDVVSARQTFPFDAVRSAFEQVTLPGNVVKSLSEPVSLRLVAPAGTRQVRLSTTVPALLRLFALAAASPGPSAAELPYSAVAQQDTTWRYAPLFEIDWVSMRASNHASLVPDQTVQVEAQIRLDPQPPSERPQVAALQLEPLGHPKRQLVIERIPPENAPRALALWGPGRFIQLVVAKAHKVNLSRHPSARPKLTYWVTGAPSEALGLPVSVLVDRTLVFTGRFTTTRGSWSLRAPRGVHKVEVRTRAKNVRLLLDCPPVDAGDLVAVRDIYELRGSPLAVRVIKHGAISENINIVVYTPEKDTRASVQMVFDNGTPARVEGRALQHWTLASRVLPLPEAEHPPILAFANVGHAEPLWPHRLVVALGDDIPPGSHTLVVSTTARGSWARLFVLTGSPVAAPAAFQYNVAEAGNEM
jgi:hypothetical protein